MGDVIQMGGKSGAPVFVLRGEGQELLSKLLTETGQFPEPPPLDQLFYPIYVMETLKTLAGGGLMLEPDFVRKYPMHFALVALGAHYSRTVNLTISKIMAGMQESPTEDKQGGIEKGLEAIHNSPMFRSANALIQYTMNTMMMMYFSPETYAGERLILVFNPLTEKVELWAGHPLDIVKPDEYTTNEPSQSPGDAPAEAS